MKIKKQNNFSFTNWCSDNKIYFLAFILPVISMTVVYLIKGVFPFGDEMYLRSDCYHQYTPYLEILQNKLRGGGSLFYTWEIGSGMNFLAIAAYYLSSPFNLLTILWPGNMADFVSFSIILKMGLAGFATTYYLTKKFESKSINAVIFGMIYALSAYFAAFSWNIMWLDCMWLLPFIILGLDRLVNEKRYKMYCIALALGIFSNYYIGIMLCIYSVIYFIYLLCVSDFDSNIGQLKARLLAFKDFAIYSILGGGLAACVILPEYFNMLMTKSADTSFPEALEEYFSILYMLFRSLICIPVADLKYPHDPNIYCTVAVFILIPLFWLCKKISIKERVGKTIIAVIMLLSFSFNIPNYIWHGLHFPNSLPCRESFLYIFLIVTMAYEAFIHIREFKPVHIIGSAGASVGLILVLQELFKNTGFFSELDVDTSIIKIIYFSIFFIALYVILFFCYRKYHDMKAFFTYLLILLVFCELTLNMSVTGIPSTSSRSGYYEARTTYDELNKAAEDMAKAEGVNFYRTEGEYHATRNDGARFGYDSVSTFSSVASAAIQDYYDEIGMQTSFNAYSYYGHTPLTAAMQSIKYEYATGACSLPNNMTLVEQKTYKTKGGQNTLKLYKYNNTLPLGFMMNTGTEASWDKKSGNPFATQNNFVRTAVNGGKNIFHQLKSSAVGTFSTKYALEANDKYTPDSNQKTFDVYFYCTTSSETLTATVTNGNIIEEQNGSTSTTTTKSFSSTNQNYICHLGNVTADSTITITAGDGQSISACYAYAFDTEAWQEDFALLNANPYTVTERTDTKISGTVTASQQGIMYTSIPYDKGWKVSVDGNESAITPICDGAFIGVLVDGGQHEVTFKYTPQGFGSGLTISILCLLTFLGLIFKDNITAFIMTKGKKQKK
ncbi:MAG: YfhO family protein [Eubacterium sp.]|nr:YfhO family protein [Eubacterium sp.]